MVSYDTKKGKQPGTLYAKWNHSLLGSGSGIASGGPENGFEGAYLIKYFNEDGETIAERELLVKKDGENYQLTWKNDGEKTAEGLGMLIDDTLAAGWHDV